MSAKEAKGAESSAPAAAPAAKASGKGAWAMKLCIVGAGYVSRCRLLCTALAHACLLLLVVLLAILHSSVSLCLCAVVRVFCGCAVQVGGPHAAMMAKHCPEIKISVVDLNKRRVDAWNSAHLPIYEPGLEGLCARSRSLPRSRC